MYQNRQRKKIDLLNCSTSLTDLEKILEPYLFAFSPIGTELEWRHPLLDMPTNLQDRLTDFRLS